MRTVLLSLLAALTASPGWAQDPPAPEESPPPTTPAPAGRFRLGRFYLTPSLRLGPIGLDTNVLYTPTDRRTDATANGGPGLELVLPFRQAGRLSAGGGLDYLYFLRTSSQRKLNGSAHARLQWKTDRSGAGIEELFQRTKGRLGFEVDRRVVQRQEGTRAEAHRPLFSRFVLRLEAGRTRFEVEEGEAFLGTDLRKTLSRRSYQAQAGLEYAFTVKTSVVVEGDHTVDRFLFDPSRDADSNRLRAGLRTDPTALISGHALAGARSFRPRKAPASAERWLPIVDVDLMLNISPKTRLGAGYSRDLAYSAFTPSGDTPTLRNEAYGARIEKELMGRFDLRLFGRRTRLVTDGAITVVLPAAPAVTALRDDNAWELGADLGYRFRSDFRIGVAGTYTKRRSTISYFGIEGLLVGATVTYQP